MSDQLKFIVSELQKPPYSRNYNLITFDSLSGEQLLQVLNDVIADIDNKHEMDIRRKRQSRQQSGCLGCWGSWSTSPQSISLMSSAKALLRATSRSFIQCWNGFFKEFPIWRRELILRSTWYSTRDQLRPGCGWNLWTVWIKNVHKENEAIKNSGYSTSELRIDIKEMENEKEIVQKRIERMQRKVEGMLEVAKKLRMEKGAKGKS